MGGGMRLITPGETAPTSVNKYLLPHEHQVITVRLHPAVLLPQSAIAAGGLLVAVAIHARGYPQLIVWILELFLLGEFLWACIGWSLSYFVVTSQRMLVTSGIGARMVSEAPLSAVRDIGFYRSNRGRLLGYGTFVLPSAPRGMTVIDFLPYPEQLYLEVCGLIFPSKGASGDD
jgi:Bacterial PH domain